MLVLLLESACNYLKYVGKQGYEIRLSFLRMCAEQESYLIVHVCSIAVSMYMFCPVWSIVPPSPAARMSSAQCFF